MKSIFTVFILFMVLAFPASAQDYEQKFNERCQKSGKTATFCTCAVSALSDHMRKNDERKLTQNKMHLKYATDALLKDPVMSQNKIDAVCKLYDEAQSYDQKATLVKRQQGHNQARQWTDKKLAAMKEKEDLVMSYGASKETNGTLVVGDYCKMNNEVNQMSRDLAESNKAIYGKVRRMMEGQIALAVFFSSGYKAGCK